MKLINTMDLLEQYIVQHSPRHHVTPNAPSTWDELREWNDTHIVGVHSMPIWDGASDKTIWSTPAMNAAFRAWHDAIHLYHGLSFEFYDELEAARKQSGMVRKEMGGLWADKAAAVVWAETAGQTIYYRKHGEFPVDQRAFVLKYLDDPFKACRYTV